MEFKVKKITENGIIPTKGSDQAAGYDLYSTENYVMGHGIRKLFKTDISIQQEKGYYGKIEGRSGLAYKFGILTLAGVIDSDYSGNIGVVLLNTGTSDFEVKKGDRIAQIIFHRHFDPKLIESNILDETTRGIGGFGSSGR